MANESYTVSGKLYKKNPIVQVSEKFRKLEFIILTEDTYPQYLQIQAGNDKCDLLNGINDGDLVTAKVNVKGRLWTNPQGEEKCFNSLELWQITKDGSSQAALVQSQQAAQVEPEGLPF